MRICVGEDFSQKLNAVAPFAWKNLSNGASYIEVEAVGDDIFIRSSTKDAAVEVKVDGFVEAPGTAYINLRALPSIALAFKGLDDETLDMVEVDNGYAFYNGNERALLIRKFDGNVSIPKIDEGGSEKTFAELSSEDLRNAFVMNADIAGSVKSMFNDLVMFETQKALNSFRVVSSDGTRLCVCEVDAENMVAPNDITSVNLSAKTVGNVLRFLPKSDEPIRCSFDSDAVSFETENYRAVMKPLGITFVSYRRILDRRGERRATLYVPETRAAVKKAALVATEQNSAVTFSFTKDTVEIGASSSDLGEAKTSVMCDYDQTNGAFRFYYRYVDDFFAKCKGEEVDAYFQEERQFHFESPKCKYVIMPLY